MNDQEVVGGHTMAHPLAFRMEPPVCRVHRAGRGRTGFTLVELLVVIAIASVLMLIGVPSLMNTLARYKVRSSAQQLEMLGREARYESIKMNQPVTLVADTRRNMFYVVSGAIAGMPPYNFPDGPGDIPGPQRVAVWEIPRGVSFAMQPASACVVGTWCQSFSFNADGSGTGVPVIFSVANQPTSKVTLVTPATGKLAVQ